VCLKQCNGILLCLIFQHSQNYTWVYFILSYPEKSIFLVLPKATPFSHSPNFDDKAIIKGRLCILNNPFVLFNFTCFYLLCLHFLCVFTTKWFLLFSQNHENANKIVFVNLPQICNSIFPFMVAI